MVGGIESEHVSLNPFCITACAGRDRAFGFCCSSMLVSAYMPGLSTRSLLRTSTPDSMVRVEQVFPGQM